MPFQYSCFISYRHCEHQLGQRIINDLYEALSSEIELLTGKKVYLDETRLQGGFLYNEALAKALCGSV